MFGGKELKKVGRPDDYQTEKAPVPLFCAKRFDLRPPSTGAGRRCDNNIKISKLLPPSICRP